MLQAVCTWLVCEKYNTAQCYKFLCSKTRVFIVFFFFIKLPKLPLRSVTFSFATFLVSLAIFTSFLSLDHRFLILIICPQSSSQCHHLASLAKSLFTTVSNNHTLCHCKTKSSPSRFPRRYCLGFSN